MSRGVAIPTAKREAETSRPANTYLTTQASPDDLGAMEGRALVGFGQELGQIGNQFTRTAMHEQALRKAQADRDEALRIQQRSLDADTAINDAVYSDKQDPMGNVTYRGLWNRSGTEALNLRSEMNAVLDREEKRALQGITDPKAYQATQRMFMQKRSQWGDRMAIRENQKRQEYTVALDKGALDSFANDAMKDETLWADEKKFSERRDLVRSIIRSNHHGEPDEVIANTEKEYIGQLYLTRVQMMASAGDPEAAQVWANKEENKKWFTGPQWVNVQKTLEPFTTAQRRDRALKIATNQGSGAAPAAEAFAVTPTDTVEGNPVPKGDPGKYTPPGDNEIKGILPFFARAQAGGVNVGAAAEAVGQRETGFLGRLERRINAVSPAGALGLMQIMPATAREISDELGDGTMLRGKSDAEIRAFYREFPAINLYHGTHYLTKMLTKYGGDLATASVAYNAGPAVADKWLRAGKDDSVLPNETRGYKAAVLENYNRIIGADYNRVNEPRGRFAGINLPKEGRIPQTEWTGIFYDKNEMFPHGGEFVDARSASIADNLGLMFYQETGIKVGINSAHRTPERNASLANAAKRSNHLTGKAFDFDISKLNDEQKANFLRMANEAGFTGAWFYGESGTHIHLDTGKPRYGGAVPGWAKPVTAEWATSVGGKERRDWTNPNGGRDWVDPPSSASALRQPDTVLPTPAIEEPVVGANDYIAPTSVGPSDGSSPLDPVMQWAAGQQAQTGGTLVVKQPDQEQSPQQRVQDEVRRQILAGLETDPATKSPLLSRREGGPAGAPGIIPHDDFDEQKALAAVDGLPGLSPADKEAVRQDIRTYGVKHRQQREQQLKNVKNEAMRQVLQGNRPDQLPAVLQEYINQNDPDFARTLATTYQDVKQGKFDYGGAQNPGIIMYRFERMAAQDPKTFANVDLESYASLVGRENFSKLSGWQGDVIKKLAEGRQKPAVGDGVITLVDTRAKALGIKDEDAALLREALFEKMIAYKERTGERMTDKEIQDALNEQTQKVQVPGSVYGSNERYVFQLAKPEENRFRSQNALDLKDTAVEIKSIDDIRPERAQNVMNDFAVTFRRPPKSDEVVKYAGDIVSLERGIAPYPDTFMREQIEKTLNGLRLPRNDANIRALYSNWLRKQFVRTLGNGS